MWYLKFGVNPQGELITIREVSSGKTNLVCPFCSRSLTAKKGKIKQHHFAHTVETCLRVRKGKLPSLPLYDNFHLQLSAKHFQLVKDLWREYGNTNYALVTVPFELNLKKLFEWTPQGYYFTDLGKIPVGGLSLSKFNTLQESLILSELNRLTNSVEMAKAIGGELLEEKLADLKIYHLQQRRILRFTLYFLEIKCDGKTLHKIGVTSRKIGLRLGEIKRDLQQHFSNININVLNTWQHRGNVELYFKHRYKQFNYRIGKLTEYYKFHDIESVKHDLYSMQPKILEGQELEIWS
ncbi:MAG: hypothetical protein QNJ70_21355 [Xenococcaceae cyanobacterium MO_207.B15]|nr:hypothetical protein [Xenococcaceae cyanobacterium MO_207.B15]